mgnify:CR=1 FL=1
MLAILLLISCAFLAADADLVSAYRRTMLLTKDSAYPPGFPPPTAPQLIGIVFDANNSQMLSSGLYTQPEIVTFSNQAKLWIWNRFGVNFSAGEVAANGTIGLPTLSSPLWVLYPYAAQKAVKVVFDTDNLGRGATLNYDGSQFGFIAVCTSDTLYPGGDHAGDKCSAANVIAYFNYDFLRNNTPPNLVNFFRETHLYTTPWESVNIVNNQGATDSLSKLEVFDEQSRRAFGMENIVFNRNFTTGGYDVKTRVIVTWNN